MQSREGIVTLIVPSSGLTLTLLRTSLAVSTESPSAPLPRASSTHAIIKFNFTTQTSRSNTPVSRSFPSHISHTNNITTQVRPRSKLRIYKCTKTDDDVTRAHSMQFPEEIFRRLYPEMQLARHHRSSKSVRINDDVTTVRRIKSTDLSRPCLETQLKRTHRSTKSVRINDDVISIPRHPEDNRRHYLEAQLSKSIDVRYTMSDLKSYFDRLSKYPFYFFSECEPLACPSLRDRFMKHLSDHHSAGSDNGPVDFSSQQNEMLQDADSRSRGIDSNGQTRQGNNDVGPPSYAARRDNILNKYSRGPKGVSALNNSVQTYSDLGQMPNSYFTSENSRANLDQNYRRADPNANKNKKSKTNKDKVDDVYEQAKKSVNDFAGGYRSARNNTNNFNNDNKTDTHNTDYFADNNSNGSKYNNNYLDPNNLKYGTNYFNKNNGPSIPNNSNSFNKGYNANGPKYNTNAFNRNVGPNISKFNANSTNKGPSQKSSIYNADSFNKMYDPNKSKYNPNVFNKKFGPNVSRYDTNSYNRGYGPGNSKYNKNASNNNFDPNGSRYDPNSYNKGYGPDKSKYNENVSNNNFGPNGSRYDTDSYNKGYGPDNSKYNENDINNTFGPRNDTNTFNRDNDPDSSRYYSNALNVRPSNSSKYDTNKGYDNASNDPMRYNTDGSHIPLMRTDTHEVLKPKQLYKHYSGNLRDTIKIWLKRVPLFPSAHDDGNIDTDKITNDLVERVMEQVSNLDSDNYEENVKREINKCLDVLHVWYPGDKRDQVPLKEEICEELLNGVRELNDKWFPIKNSTPMKKFSNSMNDSNNLDSYDRQKYTSIARSRSKSDHSFKIKCTIGSDYICDSFLGTDKKKKSPCKKDCKSCRHEIEHEISVWLKEANVMKMSEKPVLTHREVIGILCDSLSPYLRKPYNTTNRIILKSKIVDILDNLPICINCTKSQRVRLIRFAEELAKKLINIQAKFENNNYRCRKCATVHRFQNIENEIICSNSSLKNCLLEEIKFCLENTKIEHQIDVEDDILEVVVKNFDAVCCGYESVARNELFNILQRSNDLSFGRILDIIDCIFENVKDIVTQFSKESLGSASTRTLIKPCLSGTISVYTSEQEISQPSFTTPCTPKINPNIDISKLSAEEKNYMNKVAELIRPWLDTLPGRLNESVDVNFKETIINDLAGDIMDQAKSEQISPDPNADKKNSWSDIINRWLYKFEVLQDLNNVDPHIKRLLNQLKNIPIPNMTKSQYGSRQAMENVKHVEGEEWYKHFVPSAANVLKDEISIWMNEQPPDIYLDNDKSVQSKMVEELAEAVQQQQTKKRASKEISKRVAQCLQKLVKTSERKNIDKMSKNLTDRILKLPQDATLAANVEKKMKSRNELASPTKLKIAGCCQSDLPECCQTIPAECCQDQTIKEFILKYLDHNYDVDDPIARGAFAQLLKTELQKLTAPDRKAVYEKFQTSPHDASTLKNLDMQLQYIQDVSDWLKNLPVDSSYNTVGNNDRIEFVNSLAKNIAEVESERARTPEAMDYNLYLGGIISECMVQLPLRPDIEDANYKLMIAQLLNKIIVRRQTTPSVTNNTFSSVNTNGVPEQNLTDFLETYVKINGQEISDDELKMDAWSKRIVEEVKKMVQEDSSTLAGRRLSKLAYNTNEDPVRQFSFQLQYVKEIAEWLKNMPLLDLTNNVRIKMISELAERISERDHLTSNNTDNLKADKDLENYVSNWISQLPLDNIKRIDIPVATRQLMNRIENVKGYKTSGPSRFSLQKQESFLSKSYSSRNRSKPNNESIPVTTDGNLVVEAIEIWCNNLPIEGSDEDNIKTVKNETTMKLYQKVGELNDNPLIYNDDFTYEEMLGDEIDLQLQNITKKFKLKADKVKLKANLLGKVMEATDIIKQREAGEIYEQKLENTIEMSMPHPKRMSQDDDPEFSIYKHRLAEMFILDNLDHGEEAAKVKYEKKLKSDLDKYFHSAQRRNAVQLNQEQLTGELFTALYKVPVPDERSIKYEVEEVKTRCEIDSWFEELPLQDASVVGQLLEWDQMLQKLAKRVHELEKNEPNATDKIHTETMKVLTKLPLLPGQENNLNQFSRKLQIRLQDTIEVRQSGPERRDSSQRAGSSSSNSGRKRWVNSDSRQHLQMPVESPEKKSADYILEIIEDWCNQLPLPATTPQEEQINKLIREDLVTQIIIKISKLDSNPEIFKNDVLYDHLLDDDLDNLISTLPQSDALQQSKNALKYQLKESIKCIKPLVRDERARHEYKQELRNTIAHTLEEPNDVTSDKLILIDNFKEEIIDNFMEYIYNKDDESKLHYKSKIQEAMSQYLKMFNAGNDTDMSADSNIRRNQMINELSKVPMPSEAAVKAEIQEIRMKNEIDQFFNEISYLQDDSPQNNVKRNQNKTTLAKQLNEIEKNGHTSENDQKMKNEILKYFNKLGKDVNSAQIDSFINKLKQNECFRREHLSRQMFDSSINSGQAGSPYSQQASGQQIHQANLSYDQTVRSNIQASLPMYNQNVFTGTATSSAGGGNQWQTLLSSSGQDVMHPITNGGETNAGLNGSTANYSNFSGNVGLNSTPLQQWQSPGSQIMPVATGPACQVQPGVCIVPMSRVAHASRQYSRGFDPSGQQQTSSDTQWLSLLSGSPLSSQALRTNEYMTYVDNNSGMGASFNESMANYSNLRGQVLLNSTPNQQEPPFLSGLLPGSQNPYRAVSQAQFGAASILCPSTCLGKTAQSVQQPTGSEGYRTYHSDGQPIYKLNVPYAVSNNSTPCSEYTSSFRNPAAVGSIYSPTAGAEQWRTFSDRQYSGGFVPPYQPQTGSGTQWLSLLPGSTLPPQEFRAYESMSVNNHSMGQVASLNARGGGINPSLNESTIDYSGFSGGVNVNSTLAQPRRSILRNPLIGMQIPGTYNSSTDNGLQSYICPPSVADGAVPTPGGQNLSRTIQSLAPSGGSVQPWNTTSSLGSVELPSQQAIAIIHQPPAETAFQTAGNQFTSVLADGSFVPSLTSGDLNLPSSPPYSVPLYHDPMVIGKYGPSLNEGWSPKTAGGRVETTLGDSSVNYQGFGGGIPLSATVRDGPGYPVAPAHPSLVRASQGLVSGIAPFTHEEVQMSEFPKPFGGTPQIVLQPPSPQGVNQNLVPPGGLSPEFGADSTPRGPIDDQRSIAAPQGVDKERRRSRRDTDDEYLSELDCICEIARNRRRRQLCRIPVMPYCDDFMPLCRLPMPYPYRYIY